jgi:hypothetical protein
LLRRSDMPPEQPLCARERHFVKRHARQRPVDPILVHHHVKAGMLHAGSVMPAGVSAQTPTGHEASGQNNL